MEVKIYYRGLNRKLHQVNDVVGESETVLKVLKETEEQFKIDNISYSAPILALIQGSKE